MKEKKILKIKKSSAGHWSQSEKDRFMNALQKYGRDWNTIQKCVSSRNIMQIRSHAQKVFARMHKVDVQALQKKKLPSKSRNIKNTKQDEKSKKNQECQKMELMIQSPPPKNEKKEQASYELTKSKQQNNEKADYFNLPSKSYFSQALERKDCSQFLKIMSQNYNHFASGGNFLSFLTSQESAWQGFRKYKQ